MSNLNLHKKNIRSLFVIIIISMVMIFLSGLTSIERNSGTVIAGEEDNNAVKEVQGLLKEQGIDFRSLYTGDTEKNLPCPEAKNAGEDPVECEPDLPAPETSAAEFKPSAPEPAAVDQTPSAGDNNVTPEKTQQVLPAGLDHQLIALVNQARIDAGLPALHISAGLSEAARAKSRDMAEKNYFSHQSPTYGNLSGLLSSFGINYLAAGENLAMNSNGSVSAAHNSLMGSPGHRENILNRRFTHIGVGVAKSPDGSYYYTQLFTGN